MRRILPVVVLACLASACSQDSAPPTRPSPNPSRVQLAVFPPAVLLSGSDATITITVKDDAGTLVANTPVSMTTSTGTLSASSLTTDSNGLATVRLTAAEPAHVTATVGGGTNFLSVPAIEPFTVRLTSDGSGVAARITGTVSANMAAVSPPAPVEISASCDEALGFQTSPTAGFGASTFTCVYPTLGQYTAVMRAKAANGWTATAQLPVRTSTVPLTITGSQVDTSPDDAVWLFDVQPHQAGVAYYRWDFGDNGNADAESLPARHTYLRSGFMDIVVTARASDGAVVGSGRATIRVVFQ